MKDAFIVDAVRTPRARRKGKFSGIHPVDLLTVPLQGIISRQQVAAENVQDVVTGCVTQTGEQGWCIGRAAVLAAGFPYSVPATTVNRLCGSGQQAANFIAMAIRAGTYDLAIAAGIEHMTRVPMFSDCTGEPSPALQKRYPQLVQQGLAAEMVAERYGISRARLDEYSLLSHQRAHKARSEGHFKRSLLPVSYNTEQGTQAFLEQDDAIRPETSIQALAGLKTVFKEGGVITAGNASAIVDGAASILLASEQALKKFSLKPRARIVSTSEIGSDPVLMLTGPVPASQLALTRAGLSVKDIDLWEINEAFAPVPLMTIDQLGIDPSLVNVNGGAIALGHPLGATGAILLGTALDELERRQKKYALVTMCIGLGMGIATILERL